MELECNNVQQVVPSLCKLCTAHDHHGALV